MARSEPLEAALQNDRVTVAAGLMIVAGLGWLALGYEAFGARRVLDAAMRLSAASASAWPLNDLARLFVMWATMMATIMVPSIAPAILTFALINRKRHERRSPLVPTGCFLLGYLAAWTVFSFLATFIQHTLHAAGLLSPAMAFASPIGAGVVLIIAGLFQLTPIKRACLVQCRSPLRFLVAEWQEGTRGAFLMGWKIGHYGVGCCWLVMALLLVAGVLNIAWVAAISAFVLAEHAMPAGPRMGWAAGILSMAWGCWIAVSPLVRSVWQSV